MISDYNWPRSAAGSAGERADRAERKRDPLPQQGDEVSTPKQPQQTEGESSQQQQGTPPRITDWASI